MAAVAIRPLRSTPTPPPTMVVSTPQTPPAAASSPALPIPGANNGPPATPVPIPHKNVALPATSFSNFSNPVTPPASPPDEPSPSKDSNGWMASLLYPAEDYTLIVKSPPVHKIDAAGVAAAVHFMSRQPLPEIDQIFPWAHGLHSDNAMQLAFFDARKRSSRRAPACFRGICIVKVGDMSYARLKGAISPEEILPANPQTAGFLPVDPREGFNVRNFHIQVGKFACLSDIIVYGDDNIDEEQIIRVAKRISAAQLHYRASEQGHSKREFPVYSTFVVKCPFSSFEYLFPDIVAVDSHGILTGQVVDFCHWERMEMCSMSRATEISKNVWLGSTADAPMDSEQNIYQYGLIIEANELVHMPSSDTLKYISDKMEHKGELQELQFPGSGTLAPNATQAEIDGLIETCSWMYTIANGRPTQEEDQDADGDMRMSTPAREPRKILLHCTDGYTETSLLALAYIMYAEGKSVCSAWVALHTTKNRNFFAYDKDLRFLHQIQNQILEAAARNRELPIDWSTITTPDWYNGMDGSLPSRILNYMYLGNLQHANNPGLLVELGIKRVLSIGEQLSWSKEEKSAWGKGKAMVIKDLQDNGCDPLEEQFRRCLDFIDEGRRMDEPILVHCRVGVSRSATICIAEVMRSLKLSLPRAYCYVRARRLNVIIQPHLRFMYELLKFEETLPFKHPHSPKREIEWCHLAREIATMNRPYTRQN